MLLAWLGGAVITAVWAMQSPDFGWRQAAGVLCVLGCAVLAGRALTHVQPGSLHWTGQEWLWTSDAASEQGKIVVCLDIQHVMLVRFHALQTPARWLWLERRQAPQLWADLRRAAYARARVARPTEPVSL